MIEYQEYLKSDRWRRIRAWALAFWNYRCATCYSPDHLEVHHRTYERLGNELLTDLICLCDNCHELFHDKLGLKKEPVMLIDLLPLTIVKMEEGIRY